MKKSESNINSREVHEEMRGVDSRGNESTTDLKHSEVAASALDVLDLVRPGRRIAHHVHLDAFHGLSDEELSSLFDVAQPVRVVVEMVDEDAFHLQVLVEQDHPVVPAVHDQDSPARVLQD